MLCSFLLLARGRKQELSTFQLEQKGERKLPVCAASQTCICVRWVAYEQQLSDPSVLLLGLQQFVSAQNIH